MRKYVQLFGFFLFAVLSIEQSFAAQSARILGMSSQRRDAMALVSFVFDRIPEFEIQRSGQQIRLLFFQTRFAHSFQKVGPDQTLAQVQTVEDSEKSVVELYLRNLPINVDVTTKPEYARVNVALFRDQKKLGTRPAILDQGLGRLQPIEGGGVAQKGISSAYKGRWIDFFKEFEWPVEFSLPVQFSFPPFPDPLFNENEALLPDGVLPAGRRQLWEQAEEALEAAIKTADSSRTTLYALLLSECHLRNKRPEPALQTLRGIENAAALSGGRAWKAYLRASAQAISGKYFLAANIAEAGQKFLKSRQAVYPWYRLLQAELGLMTGKFEKTLQYLDMESGSDGRFARIVRLRKADALFALGKSDAAFAGYQQLASNLALFRDSPSSLANWSELLYSREKFAEAYRYFLLLSEVLKAGFPESGALADYWSAMARWKEGRQNEARQMFINNQENFSSTEAGFRSWLKLLDFSMLQKKRADLKIFVMDYSDIIAAGPTRQIREEAYFKQTLAYHIHNENLQAVKCLGRFFNDYWAGDLQADAQALFVEIFPQVIDGLVERGFSFQALTLVAKHRDLLAQARISYDFLHGLAESYRQAGFFKQTAETYLYMLDFEKSRAKKKQIFPLLLDVYDQLQDYEKVEQYAQNYLESYPQGSERDDVLYFYAKALLKKNDRRTALRRLLEKNRPESSALDRLSGELCFVIKQYDLVEHYLSKASEGTQGPVRWAMTWKRAEAFFVTKRWNKAKPLYKDLLDKSGFTDQAAYRLIETYFHLEEPQKALKLYEKMTEKQEQSLWLDLAAESLVIHNSMIKEN